MKPAKPLLACVALDLLIAVWVLLRAAARFAYDWCRPRPDCPVGRALRSAVAAALAGAPFFLLLAVAGLAR